MKKICEMWTHSLQCPRHGHIFIKVWFWLSLSYNFCTKTLYMYLRNQIQKKNDGDYSLTLLECKFLT